MIRRIKVLKSAVLFLIAAIIAIAETMPDSSHWHLFSNPVLKQPTLENDIFLNTIHIGSNNDKRSTCVNLGFDFPLFSYQYQGSNTLGLGIVSLMYLYMFPQDRKFNVDNFYASFGCYISGTVSKQLSIRLYPLYHLSAHLGDGYLDGDIAQDKKTISNEMVYLKARYIPFLNMEAALGTGYYYHTVYRKNLTGRIDLDLRYQFPAIPISISLKPFIGSKNQIIEENGFRFGYETIAGISAYSNSGTGLSLAFRYFDKPHQGQYFEENETGYGLDIVFNIFRLN